MLDKGPISKLCDELGLQPTVFYRWQKEFFENGASAFEQKARPNHSAEQEGEAGHHRLSSEEPAGGLPPLASMMLDANIVAVSPTSV